MDANAQPRRIELDLLRSLALAMMVLYHLLFDLHQFYNGSINPLSPGWILFARSTLTLFLLLVGSSFALSWERSSVLPPCTRIQKYLRRGAGLITCGLLISAVTYFLDPSSYIRFGILHMIGVSIILLSLFAPLREWNAVVGVMLLMLGPSILAMRTSTVLFVPIGLQPEHFVTVDYVPLIPWFGAVLLGYAAGYWIYILKRIPIIFVSDGIFLRMIALPGRHSLLIYLVHQPVVLAMLWVIFQIY